MPSNSSHAEPGQDARVVGVLRRLLLATLWLGSLGLLAELLLIGHTETVWQLVPIGLLGVEVAALSSWLLWPRRATIRALQLVAVGCVVSGLVGLFQHYRGNEEFELEMYPDLEGAELLWEVMTGATPVLAPGAMMQIGLLALAYAHRHPMARGATDGR